MTLRLSADAPAEALRDPSAVITTRRTTNVGYDLEAGVVNGTHVIRWIGACGFHLNSEGTEMICNLESDTVRPSWLASLFYGVVLSYVLHVRGQINLHAGAITTSRGALGILAEAGTGKSTLTAHLAASGFPFLTDDIVAPIKTDGRYVVPPGFPYVSMTAESIESLFSATAVPDGMVRDNVDVKERIKVDGDWARFEEKPQPLRALVVMTRGEGEHHLQELGPQEAVLALMQHSVALPVLPRDLVGKHMASAADLVKSIPVWRFEVPTGLEHIPETVDVIRRNFE